ncbi:MAG: hypothetical protein LBD98_03195 [Endomicrobium sp.]|jgi:hypothetical protein|nr:hypothetical protein [Endomicrobium sp.]
MSNGQQQQKLLLLPPMKGLNLYDNPFTLSPEFAVSLINFMPPTTELKVRPGLKRIAQIYGTIKGIYSYNTGATIQYGKNWYDQTIKYGDRQVLLLKFFRSNGKSIIYSFNPLNNQMDQVAEMQDSTYSKDYCMYQHSIFFTSGNMSSPMYIWNSKFGFKKMAWHTAGSSYHEISNLENITFYNGFVFANAYNTFDFYWMPESSVDVNNASNWLDKAWSFFQPKNATALTIDGFATLGGAILKMFSLSRAGLESMSDYFVVCTTMGEIICFTGIPSTDAAKSTWKVAGRYRIPVPLNKESFCKMEGDVIVATKNGLYSLMRVVFGHQTEVTNSLEYRVKNVFDDYMFTMPVFAEHIKLFYNEKNRLLILNLPTSMPISFSSIKKGYTFTEDQYIILPAYQGENVTVDAKISSTVIEQSKAFISSYLYPNQLDYKIVLQFNDSSTDGIFVTFKTEVFPYNVIVSGQNSTLYKGITTVDFYIVVRGIKTSFLEQPLIFTCENIKETTFNVILQTSFQWNHALLKEYSSLNYYAYKFPAGTDTWTVTNMYPTVSFFSFHDIFPSVEYASTDSFIPAGITQMELSRYVLNEYWNVDNTLIDTAINLYNSLPHAGNTKSSLASEKASLIKAHPNDIPPNINFWQYQLISNFLDNTCLSIISSEFDLYSKKTARYKCFYKITNNSPLSYKLITHTVVFQLYVNLVSVTDNSATFYLDKKESGFFVDDNKIFDIWSESISIGRSDGNNLYTLTEATPYFHFERLATSQEYLIDYVDSSWQTLDFYALCDAESIAAVFSGFFLMSGIKEEGRADFLKSVCFPMGLVHFSDIPVTPPPLPPEPPTVLFENIDISDKFRPGTRLTDEGFYIVSFSFESLIKHPITTQSSVSELVKRFICCDPYDTPNFLPQHQEASNKRFLNLSDLILDCLASIAPTMEKKVISSLVGFSFTITYTTEVIFKNTDTQEYLPFSCEWVSVFSSETQVIDTEVTRIWVAEIFVHIYFDGHSIVSSPLSMKMKIGNDFRLREIFQEATGQYAYKEITKDFSDKWITFSVSSKLECRDDDVKNACLNKLFVGNVVTDADYSNWFYFGGWIFTALSIKIASLSAPPPPHFEFPAFPANLSYGHVPQSLSWYTYDTKAINLYNRNIWDAIPNLYCTYFFYEIQRIDNVHVAWEDVLTASVNSVCPPTNTKWNYTDFSSHPDPIAQFGFLNFFREYILSILDSPFTDSIAPTIISFIKNSHYVKLRYEAQYNNLNLVLKMKMSMLSPDNNDVIDIFDISLNFKFSYVDGIKVYETISTAIKFGNYAFHYLNFGDLRDLSSITINRTVEGTSLPSINPMYSWSYPTNFGIDTGRIWRSHYSWLFSMFNYIIEEKPAPWPTPPAPGPEVTHGPTLLKDWAVGLSLNRTNNGLEKVVVEDTVYPFEHDSSSPSFSFLSCLNNILYQYTLTGDYAQYNSLCNFFVVHFRYTGLGTYGSSLRQPHLTQANALKLEMVQTITLNANDSNLSAQKTFTFTITYGLAVYWRNGSDDIISPYLKIEYKNVTDSSTPVVLYDDSANIYSSSAGVWVLYGSTDVQHAPNITQNITTPEIFSNLTSIEVIGRTVSFQSPNDSTIDGMMKGTSNAFQFSNYDSILMDTDELEAVNEGYFGYLFSLFEAQYLTPNKKEEEKERAELAKKNLELTNQLLKTQSKVENYSVNNSMNDSVNSSVNAPILETQAQQPEIKAASDNPPPLQAVQNTNFDLALVPIFTNVNILAPFRSTQFVMDSYYGTWSQWEDVNMIDGIDHLNEFYMIVPDDYQPSTQFNNFVYNKSSLVKFDPNANGDYEDWIEFGKTHLIKVSYKTAATNFNIPNLKQVNNVSIFGTGSTFWGDNAKSLRIALYTDFHKNDDYYYQHNTNLDNVKLKLLKKIGLDKSYLRYNANSLVPVVDFHRMSYVQRQQYYKAYLEESAMIKNILINTMNKVGSRIALEMHMEIAEHNIIIYGYEVFFKILNKF